MNGCRKYQEARVGPRFCGQGEQVLGKEITKGFQHVQFPWLKQKTARFVHLCTSLGLPIQPDRKSKIAAKRYYTCFTYCSHCYRGPSMDIVSVNSPRKSLRLGTGQRSQILRRSKRHGGLAVYEINRASEYLNGCALRKSSLAEPEWQRYQQHAMTNVQRARQLNGSQPGAVIQSIVERMLHSPIRVRYRDLEMSFFDMLIGDAHAPGCVPCSEASFAPW